MPCIHDVSMLVRCEQCDSMRNQELLTVAKQEVADSTCQRCGEVGEDRRTLWMACFYEMQELGLPFGRKSLLEADPAHLKLHKPAPTLPLGNGVSINIGGGEVTTDQPLGVRGFYTLRVCKDCRATWMSAIKNWFEWIDTRERRSPGTGIFIRRNGANVEVTEEEFREMAAKKEIE